MKATQKRNVRSYKIIDKAYDKAMKRAKKDKIKLASMIEVFVFAYANGEVDYVIESTEKSN